jgi:hypothetical protein
MNTIPQELNWVEKRAACTVAEVFHQLCEGVMRDVDAVNVARRLPTEERFKVDPLTDGTTIVIGQLGQTPRIVVRIGIVHDQIMVSHQPISEPDWSAKVSLNDEGRCTLRTTDDEKKAELEQWQFRKKALAGLFFGDKP